MMETYLGTEGVHYIFLDSFYLVYVIAVLVFLSYITKEFPWFISYFEPKFLHLAQSLGLNLYKVVKFKPQML